MLDAIDTGKWELYNSPDPLPGNYVQDIKLDSKGNLWYAIYGKGVSMYDGKSWTDYNTSNSELRSNYVNCIEEDADGDMWFGLKDGISFLIDGSDWYYIYDADTTMNVLTIKTTSDGYTWAGTDGAGLYVYYNGEWIFISGRMWAGLEEWDHIHSIEEDASGHIWLGTDYGVCRWDNSSWEWFPLEYALPVWAIFNDSKERLWFGTAGSPNVAYYDGSDFNYIPLYNGYGMEEVTDIQEDRKGDIWFGTWFHGAIRYDGVAMHSYKESVSFFDDEVECIEEDAFGNIWFGGWENGAAKYVLPVDY